MLRKDQCDQLIAGKGGKRCVVHTAS
jgi:hypothetical protein